MESGGETFYIKKETTAQSSNLESCVTTRTVDISGLRFQPSPRFFAREKGQVGKWSGEGEEEEGREGSRVGAATKSIRDEGKRRQVQRDERRGYGHCQQL